METAYKIDNGLIVDASTDPPTCCGYIFNFGEHGAFSPNGKVNFTEAEQKEHNKLLADAEWTGMLKHGRGLLYLSKNADGEWHVSDWPGVHKVIPYHIRTSWHNMAGKNGRTDAWFNLDGSTWHGVNIGDNQILRVKRTKN